MTPPRTACRVFLALALFAALGQSAQAHLVTTGLGPVYDGIGHFVMSPDDWVAVVALALLAGLRGTAAARRLLVVLPLAWLVGGMVPGPAVAPAIPLAGIVFLLVGILIASDWALPLWGLAVLAGLVGLLQGWLNGIAVRHGTSDVLTWLLGVGGCVFLLATLVAGAVTALRPAWTRIAIRVLGSWIAATGLLLIGWALRPAGH